MVGQRGVAVPAAVAAVFGGGAVLAAVALGCAAARPPEAPAIVLPQVLPPVPLVFRSEAAVQVPGPARGNPS